jgi:hypothetical protein
LAKHIPLVYLFTPPTPTRFVIAVDSRCRFPEIPRSQPVATATTCVIFAHKVFADLQSR